jgi:hypothetical protein
VGRPRKHLLITLQRRASSPFASTALLHHVLFPSHLSRPSHASTATSAPPTASAEDDVDSLIDASTLSYLRTSLLTLFAPWLFKLIVFTSVAKLVRFFSPYLFTAIRWTVGWAWWAVEGAAKLSAWGAMWGGLVATALWLAGGAFVVVAYGAILLKPRWRAFEARSPGQASGVKKAVGYGAGWVLVKKLLGKWLGRVFVVAVLGWEAYSYSQRSRSVKIPSSSSTRPPRPSATPAPSSAATTTPPSSAVPEDGADSATDAEAERWARQVKEEMLKNSLLRAGRKGAGVAAEVEPSNEEQGSDGVDEDDMPDLVEATGKTARGEGDDRFTS